MGGSSGKRGGKDSARSGVCWVGNKDAENINLGARFWLSELKVGTPLFGKTFVNIFGTYV